MRVDNLLTPHHEILSGEIIEPDPGRRMVRVDEIAAPAPFTVVRGTTTGPELSSGRERSLEKLNDTRNVSSVPTVVPHDPDGLAAEEDDCETEGGLSTI